MREVVVQGAGGIGAALVRGLLARPEVERVWATTRKGAAVSGIDDPRCHPLALDVCDPETIEAAAARVKAESGRLDLLINASGVLHDDAGLRPEKRLEALDADALAQSFAVNAIGPMLVARAFFPLLAHGERSVLANLSAKVGSIGDNRAGGWYGYRASKAALNQLTKTFALETARRAPQLVCIALHPGTVDTRLSAPFQRGLPPEQLQDPDAAAARLLAVIDACEPAWNGSFRSWDGQELPW